MIIGLRAALGERLKAQGFRFQVSGGETGKLKPDT